MFFFFFFFLSLLIDDGMSDEEESSWRSDRHTSTWANSSRKEGRKEDSSWNGCLFDYTSATAAVCVVRLCYSISTPFFLSFIVSSSSAYWRAAWSRVCLLYLNCNDQSSALLYCYSIPSSISNCNSILIWLFVSPFSFYFYFTFKESLTSFCCVTTVHCNYRRRNEVSSLNHFF
jgi:hypothetical protein